MKDRVEGLNKETTNVYPCFTHKTTEFVPARSSLPPQQPSRHARTSPREPARARRAADWNRSTATAPTALKSEEPFHARNAFAPTQDTNCAQELRE